MLIMSCQITPNLTPTFCDGVRMVFKSLKCFKSSSATFSSSTSIIMKPQQCGVLSRTISVSPNHEVIIVLASKHAIQPISFYLTHSSMILFKRKCNNVRDDHSLRTTHEIPSAFCFAYILLSLFINGLIYNWCLSEIPHFILSHTYFGILIYLPYIFSLD